MGLTLTKLSTGNVDVTGGEFSYTIPSSAVPSITKLGCTIKTEQYVKIVDLLVSDVDAVETGTETLTITTPDELYEALNKVFNTALGGSSAPDTEITYGSGTGISSSDEFFYDDVLKNLVKGADITFPLGEKTGVTATGKGHQIEHNNGWTIGQMLDPTFSNAFTDSQKTLDHGAITVLGFGSTRRLGLTGQSNFFEGGFATESHVSGDTNVYRLGSVTTAVDRIFNITINLHGRLEDGALPAAKLYGTFKIRGAWIIRNGSVPDIFYEPTLTENSHIMAGFPPFLKTDFDFQTTAAGDPALSINYRNALGSDPIRWVINLHVDSVEFPTILPDGPLISPEP